MDLRRLALVLAVAAIGLALPAGRANADLPDALRAYQRGEFEAAAAELMPLAEEGNPRAQYQIGRMRFYGQALVQDAAAAAHWYRRSAEQGYAPAQLAYAIALDGGWGVPRDPGEAVRWYRVAALQGELTAMWRLAYHYRRGVGVLRDLAEAWAWFDRLAELGDNRAAGERDWLELVGLDEEMMLQAKARSAALGRELQAAPLLAERWLKEAAAQGYVAAQLELAELYRGGDGVAPDPVEAMAWFLVALNALEPGREREAAKAASAELAAILTEPERAEAERRAAQLRTTAP